MIDAPAAQDFKILGLFGGFGLRLVEGVHHGRSVQRLLLHAVNHLGRDDLQDIIDGGSDIIDMMELGTDFAIVFYFFRPGDDQRRSGPAEVRGDQFGALERCRSRKGPAMVIHDVQLLPAQHVHSTIIFVEYIHLLFDGGGHPILGQQFTDCPVHAFSRWAVVGEYVENQGIVQQSLLFEFIDDLAVLYIRVLQEPGINFH